MKQKSSLDIARFFCAVLVLLIHANPFADYSKIMTMGCEFCLCSYGQCSDQLADYKSIQQDWLAEENLLIPASE